MKTIIATLAVTVALAGFAVSPSATAAVAPNGALSSPAAAPAAAGTQLAHGLHLYCAPGPRRGWVHRHGIWSLGIPTAIGCY